MRSLIGIFVLTFLVWAAPAAARNMILYKDWKNCVSLMVDEQTDRGSMVPLVMKLNSAMQSCKPEATIFAEDFKARSPGMSTRAYVKYLDQIAQQIRDEVAADHAD